MYSMYLLRVVFTCLHTLSMCMGYLSSTSSWHMALLDRILPNSKILGNNNQNSIDIDIDNNQIDIENSFDGTLILKLDIVNDIIKCLQIKAVYDMTIYMT